MKKKMNRRNSARSLSRWPALRKRAQPAANQG
jgi:hypothetical protein